LIAGSYEYFSRKLSATTSLPKWGQNFISGGLAATTLWIASFPFDVVKNRMMTQPLSGDKPYKTVRQCFEKIYAREGIKGFYRGFTPCILRSFPANGAAFVAIELTLKYLP
jgi:solute carrier family 25 carnitine/acylcarnitine transporter 20/29